MKPETEADLVQLLSGPITIEGRSIQTLADSKALVMVNKGPLEGDVVLVMAYTMRVADGTTIVDNDVYRCGSYTYTTARGSIKEISRYGLDAGACLPALAVS